MNDAERQEMELYLTRTLNETAPVLKNYLKKGDAVLDVGCGPGTITLDVAREVFPGSTVGIEHVAHRVEKAQQLALAAGRHNVTFQVGDANTLPFPDAEFDLVYSHTVLHYFWDPEAALAEQRRVLKPGGWLIAAGVRDWGLVQRYPKCPNWDALIEARIRFAQARTASSTNLRWERRPSMAYTQTGRRCPEWFTKLGMKDIRVEVETCKIEYAGAKEMEPHPMDLLPWDEDDQFGYHTDYRTQYEMMIAAGFLKQDTVELAMKEARQWFVDPAAFHFYALVTIAGRR